MSPSTEAIFGRQVMNRITVADYIDWAIGNIVDGKDSPNLRMLSGLDAAASPFEAELHFNLALRELGILEPDRTVKLRAYAHELAQRILDESLPAREGVYLLYRICVLLDYPKRFMVWLNLDDALEDIRAGSYPMTFQTANAQNFDEIAKSEAKKFIEAESN